jgi:hypothetical protein
MKVNLKKIGAIVAGATILASSAAFAGLMFGSTTLVDDNGAPVAKVVVGSKAMPSDGVAAALIAGKMVSEAYKSQTLTAQVSGTAACTPGAAGNASGTCSISNEKARLEITVPGAAAAGTWTGDNLIGDYLNRQLLDREGNVDNTDSDEAYEIGTSDTSDNANPFTDGAGGDIGSGEQFFYRIDGGQFSPFADASLMDDDAGNTYVEKQDMWLKGDNEYDSDPNDIVGRVDFLAYSLKFDGPGGKEIGIPECTQAEDQDFSDCKDGTGDTNIDDATETHRMKVWFLGEQWIISEMNAPTTSATTDENTLVAGGNVKLAKESVAGILNQGESLPVDNLKFQLDDLEAHGETTSAILSIVDANGNVLKKDKVNPGNTKEFNVNGKSYRFHVYKVAPGYTFGAKWADVAIFSQELDLVDGQELDQDNDNNPGWQVALGWKNQDAAIGAPVVDGGDPEKPDTLRTIVLYADSPEDISSSGDDTLQEGDYLSIVQDPEVWKLSYKGLSLTSQDMKNLKFDLKTSSKSISQSKGPDIDNSGTQDACLILAPYVQVTSSETGSVFEAQRTDGPGGTLSDNEFFVALNTADSVALPNGGDTGIGNFVGAVCDLDDDNTIDSGDYFLQAGSVFMKISATGDNYGTDEYILGATNGLPIKYQKVADGDNGFSPPDGGSIVIEDQAAIDAVTAGGNTDGFIGGLLDSAGYAACSVGTCPDFMFAIAEKAGTGSSNEFVDYYAFGVSDTGTGTPGDATFDFSSSDGTKSYTSDNQEILYGHAVSNPTNFPAAAAETGFYAGPVPSGPVQNGVEKVEENYVSERGSEFKRIDDNSVEFSMAHKLAKAQWFLAPSSTSAADAEKTVVTLGEGESTTVGGVTVKVLEITEDVGACSAGAGSVSCTADMSGVSAVIMPNNAPSVTVAMPYTGTYGNLVVLDSDAVGVNTLVSVGGDKVNSVTADLLQGSAVDWTATPKVVREVVQGSKIVVAGKEASDTLEAAQDFVSQVKKV